jgi:hypothetical protein
MANTEAVQRLLEGDAWHLGSGIVDRELWILRWREPVPFPDEVEDYASCHQVVWAWAPERSRVPLDPATNDEMHAFEVRLRERLESDALAVLVTVLTFDGARQWVFYSHDDEECSARIDAVLDEEDSLPIELGRIDDAGWRYFRENFLARARSLPRADTN